MPQSLTSLGEEQEKEEEYEIKLGGTHYQSVNSDTLFLSGLNGLEDLRIKCHEFVSIRILFKISRAEGQGYFRSWYGKNRKSLE